MDNPRISINKPARVVRVWEGGRGGQQTYFYVKEYGSWDKAYRAAVDYEKTLPAYCRLGNRKPKDRASSRSDSEIVGVCPRRNRDGDQIAWRAFWVDPDSGKPKSRDYYFSIHGNAALSKAKKKRAEMVEWAESR